MRFQLFESIFGVVCSRYKSATEHFCLGAFLLHLVVVLAVGVKSGLMRIEHFFLFSRVRGFVMKNNSYIFQISKCLETSFFI
jgi:hypothetical protein